MQLKTVQDYYEEMFKLYPTIPKSDIKRILQFGFKSFYLHNSYGGDVSIQQRKFNLYCGRMMKDSLQYFNYYKKKMCIKLRVMYKRKNIPWDGYYYFALTNKQYDNYLSQKNKKGRPRKHFDFGPQLLYKLQDECSIIDSGRVALFRIPMPIDFGWQIFKSRLITEKAEFLLYRDPLKFKDILLSNYDYQFISDYLRTRTKNRKIDGESNSNS